MYRSLWVPGGRAEPFFPLCPRRSSWIRCPRAGAELPPARVAAHAPSGIIRTRSQRYASFWRASCCGNCLTALFAGCLQAERRHRTRLPRCNFAGLNVLRCANRPRNSTSLNLSTAIQRSPPTPFPSGAMRRPLPPPNDGKTQRTQPAFLAPAQQMRAQQSGKAILDRRNGPLANGRRTNKIIDRLHGLRPARLRRHVTLSGSPVCGIGAFYDPVVLD